MAIYRFKLGDLTVSFPYEAVYPEQYEYMKEMATLLNTDGHAILEMPTGTGKTVCLLSLILSFIKQKKPSFKLIYCTRTIVEMEKTLEELKFVQKTREQDFPASSPDASLGSPILAMCLSSRRNLCIHPKVSKEDDRERVDSLCRAITAPWAEENKAKDTENPPEKAKGVGKMTDIEDLGGRCKFYDSFQDRQD